MMTKLLTTAAALAVVLPVSAHAEQAAQKNNQSQQRQIERSQYENERSEVRGRLSQSQNESVAEQRATPARPKSASPSSLNDASPADGNDRTAPAAPAKPSSYNE